MHKLVAALILACAVAPASSQQADVAVVEHGAVVVTGPDTGIAMGGTQVDENEVLASDFGQWDLDRS